MDDFGAFKKWRTEFIQQILMAFGSVIGMNIFFLVLPYINNIAFFNIYLIDAIVSVVVMVTGLMIIKSLISFFSGLVGGADALKEGDDIKGDLGKTLATSAKVAVGVGSGVAKINPAYNAAITGIKGKAAQGWAAWNKRKADKLNEKADNLIPDNIEKRKQAAEKNKTNIEKNEIDKLSKGTSKYQDIYKNFILKNIHE